MVKSLLLKGLVIQKDTKIVLSGCCMSYGRVPDVFVGSVLACGCASRELCHCPCCSGSPGCSSSPWLSVLLHCQIFLGLTWGWLCSSSTSVPAGTGACTSGRSPRWSPARPGAAQLHPSALPEVPGSAPVLLADHHSPVVKQRKQGNLEVQEAAGLDGGNL